MSPDQLQERLLDYLELRRTLAIPLGRNAAVLSDFVAFVEKHCDSQPVTTQLALDWLDFYSAQRKLTNLSGQLSLVRKFLMYVSSSIDGTEVPDIGLLAARGRGKPFVFTSAEVEAMLDAAGSFGPVGSFFPVTLKAVLGVMACTGLRVSEALKLNREHVMPKSNPADLVILESKFQKSRLVPLHPTAAKQLSLYAGHRELLGYSRFTAAFFVNHGGLRLAYPELLKVFRTIMNQLALKPRGGSRQPTLHSLRHTFAVTRLRRWHEENIDVRAYLAHLSAYLGHVDIRETYWYLTATPELLVSATKRFGKTEEDAR
jgi:integrase/recombinase XerD